MKINHNAVKKLSGQEKLFRDYKIDLAYLFGSFAEGRNTPLSDFDVAVLLNPKVKKEDYTLHEWELWMTVVVIHYEEFNKAPQGVLFFLPISAGLRIIEQTNRKHYSDKNKSNCVK